MRFWFVIGTAAELIKIYPLLEMASKQGVFWRVLLTGQSGINVWVQIEDFTLPKDRFFEVVPTNRDLKTSGQALRWFSKAVLNSPVGLRRRVLSFFGEEILPSDHFIVHGDTLSTLVGSIWGQRLKTKIVHVEAGMRSHCWWAPFPEEITRRVVSRLSHFHMAPDANAADNLRNELVKGQVLETGGNTVLDSLQLVLQDPPLVTRPYVIANIHRFETLSTEVKWKRIVELIRNVAARFRVVFVLMPNTQKKLEEDFASKEALLQSGVELKARLPFKQFAKLLHGAEFVLTDGGSNQQECHYIGKPCLLLRDVTESIEGINGSCVLSKFDEAVMENFLQNYRDLRAPPAFPQTRPTDKIFDFLQSHLIP